MNANLFQERSIIAASVDDLVVEGIQHIRKHGERLEGARAGAAIQAHDVNYILTNSQNRVHSLRAPRSVQYLARELILYFLGTRLAVDMARASKKWLEIKNPDGSINSNYGRYVFHDKVENNLSQYEWCVRLLAQKPHSRRAIININNLSHKVLSSLDMPCTIAIEFLVIQNYLCARVQSRSTDVIKGLPYDMGFFSFLTELVWQDLRSRGLAELKLGNTVMKTTYTQIYDVDIPKADAILEKRSEDYSIISMPHIDSAKQVLADIYGETASSKTVQWCYEHAK